MFSTHSGYESILNCWWIEFVGRKCEATNSKSSFQWSACSKVVFVLFSIFLYSQRILQRKHWTAQMTFHTFQIEYIAVSWTQLYNLE